MKTIVYVSAYVSVFVVTLWAGPIIAAPSLTSDWHWGVTSSFAPFTQNEKAQLYFFDQLDRQLDSQHPRYDGLLHIMAAERDVRHTINLPGTPMLSKHTGDQYFGGSVAWGERGSEYWYGRAVQPVPELNVWLMMGLGLAGITWVMRCKKT